MQAGHGESSPRILALFTGGKDSTHTILEAWKLLPTARIDAVLIHPSLPQPNPHAHNREAVKAIAGLLGVTLHEIGPERIGDALASLARGYQAILAGDIHLWDHAEWLRQVALQSGTPAVIEPIFNADTHRLIHKIIDEGIEFTIIGVGKPELEHLLGKRITRENKEWFLAELEKTGADPMGEYAEYHTLINKIPGHPWTIQYTIEEIVKSHGWTIAKVTHNITWTTREGEEKPTQNI